MTSVFKFNDVERKLKIEAALPTTLCELFKIGDLMLIDEDGEIYHRKDDKFEPILVSGKQYVIDEVTTKNGNMPTTTVSNHNGPEKGAVMTVAQNAENLLRQTLASTTFVSDSAGLLFLSTHAPFIIDYIAILSSAAKDPNLISENMPRDKFEKLSTPESFQSCIFQISTDICHAYRIGDHSMNTIKSVLRDLPDYFISGLEIMSQPQRDAKSQRTLESLRKRIEDASKTCKTKASEAHAVFSEVMETIEELCHATVVSNTTNSRQLNENHVRKEILDIDKSAKSELNKSLQQEAEESKIRRDQAQTDYRDTMQKDSTFTKLAAVSLAQLGGQAIKAWGGTKSPEAELCKSDPCNPDIVSTMNTAKIGFEMFTESLKKFKPFEFDSMKYAMHVDLMQKLERIANSLGYPLDQQTISCHIATLKDYETKAYGTTEGASLLNKASELRQFLEANGQNLESENIKAAAQDLKASIKNTVATCSKSIEAKQMQQSVERTAEMSLQEQVIKAEADKVRAASEQYNQERAHAEKVRNELNKNAEELRNIIRELRQIDLTTVDLTGYIQYLKNALQYLSKIKKSWSYLVEFFDNIKIVVDNNLTSNALLFSQQIKDDCSQSLQLRSALKATAYCIQITNCAEIYTATSREFIMPVVLNVGEQFSLTMAEAKKKQYDIQNHLAEVEDGVQRLIDEKKAEFDEKVDQQMKEFAVNLTNAIQHGSTSGFNYLQ